MSGTGLQIRVKTRTNVEATRALKHSSQEHRVLILPAGAQSPICGALAGIRLNALVAQCELPANCVQKRVACFWRVNLHGKTRYFWPGPSPASQEHRDYRKTRMLSPFCPIRVRESMHVLTRSRCSCDCPSRAPQEHRDYRQTRMLSPFRPKKSQEHRD